MCSFQSFTDDQVTWCQRVWKTGKRDITLGMRIFIQKQNLTQIIKFSDNSCPLQITHFNHNFNINILNIHKDVYLDTMSACWKTTILTWMEINPDFIYLAFTTHKVIWRHMCVKSPGITLQLVLYIHVQGGLTTKLFYQLTLTWPTPHWESDDHNQSLKHQQ